MAKLSTSSLMLGIQAINKQIEYFEGLLSSETVKDKHEIQELLLSYDQALEEYKAAYTSQRLDSSNFPPIEELI